MCRFCGAQNFFSYWRTGPGLTLWILLVLFIFQISDFYQRRMIQSSSSVEQDRSKEPVEQEQEQELEVWAPAPPSGPRMDPASRLTCSLPFICRFW